jgi:hypothetical protein
MSILKKNMTQVKATGIFPPKKVVRHEDQVAINKNDQTPSKSGMSKQQSKTAFSK